MGDLGLFELQENHVSRFKNYSYEPVIMKIILDHTLFIKLINGHTYREGHSLADVVLINHPQHGTDLFPAILSLRDVSSIVSGPAHREDSPGMLGAQLEELHWVHGFHGGFNWTGKDVSVQPEREGYLW